MKSYSNEIPDVKELQRLITISQVIEQKVNLILTILVSVLGFEILTEAYHLFPVVVTFIEGLMK
jgi:hypothetical protein